MDFFWIEALVLTLIMFFLIHKRGKDFSFWGSTIFSVLFGVFAAWIINFVLSMIAWFFSLAIFAFVFGGVIWVGFKAFNHFNKSS